MTTMPYETGDPGEDWGGEHPVSPSVAPPVSLFVAPPVAPVVSQSDDDGRGEGNDRPFPAAAAEPPARRRLAAVAGSHHVGGGPHGLAAFLADPRPEPLETHFRYAGNAVRAAMDPAGENRVAEAGKAAYHILAAIPLKMLAKTIRRGADILDCAPDAPHILVLAAVISGVIAAVILLG